MRIKIEYKDTTFSGALTGKCPTSPHNAALSLTKPHKWASVQTTWTTKQCYKIIGDLSPCPIGQKSYKILFGSLHSLSVLRNQLPTLALAMLVRLILALRVGRDYLNFDTVLLAEVFHHHGWEVLRLRLYIIGTQELPIGLQPPTEGVPTHARCAGQFGFGI